MNPLNQPEIWHEAPPPAGMPPVLAADLTFPLRREAGAAEVDLQRYADELAEWLILHPGEQGRYAKAGAWIAYQVAMRMATSGFVELSLYYFEMAASWNPEFPDSRIHHAVALHSLGMNAAALEQYEAALPFLDPLTDAHVFQLAAILHVRCGDPNRAKQLLRRAAVGMPEDESFWDLWASLEPPPDESGASLTNAPPPLPPPPPDPKRFCPHCGQAISPTARFCAHCGQSLTKP